MEKEQIAHQYKIRLEKEQQEKDNLPFDITKVDLKNTIVKKITKSEVEPIIKQYEWLGKLPYQITYCFGIYFIIDDKEYLGGVVTYSSEYSANTDNWDKYGFTNKMILLSRGVCLWWTPKNTGSFFIKRTFDWLLENTNYEVVTATIDPMAGEVGVIYQSLNFYYFGLMDGNKNNTRLAAFLNGKKYSTRGLRKIYGTISKKELLRIEPTMTFAYEFRKRRYFYFLKNKKEHYERNKQYIKPYPKKEEIFGLLKNINGIIYKITNTINGKLYIGQTSRDLQTRINDYKNHNGHNDYLTNAFNKHGFDNFVFEQIDSADNIYELNQKEKYYIEFYDTTNRDKGYNLRSGGDRPVVTNEVREKQSKSHKGIKQSEEWINKRIKRGEEHHGYGVPKTEEYKKKLSEATKGENSYWYGKKRPNLKTKYTRQETDGIKIVEFNRFTNEIINVYPSLGEAVRQTGRTSGTINSHCKGKIKKYISDITFRYATDEEKEKYFPKKSS
jgi:group I intron endonuclease